MWKITEQDLAPISIGAGILGTGGGGNSYLGYLRVRQYVRAGRTIEVIDPSEVGDSDLLVSTGGMGSPVVSYEKLPQGEEEANAVRALQEYLGRDFAAIAPFEIGGGNSMTPLAVGALLGIPVVDGDGMGRALPELQMITYLIYGGSAFPSAVADERGNCVVFSPLLNAPWLEKLARSVTIVMGGHAGLATAVMDGAHCKRSIIPNTLRLAHAIGTSVLEARQNNLDPVEAVTSVTGGRRYLGGKVVDVTRRTTKGFARGSITVEGTEMDEGRRIRIDFQNENLVIWEAERPQVIVPDLITLVGTDNGDPITTEVVRYGLRADVLVLPCPDLLKTEEALAVVGPRAFGFDMDYSPFV